MVMIKNLSYFIKKGGNLDQLTTVMKSPSMQEEKNVPHSDHKPKYDEKGLRIESEEEIKNWKRI